MSLNLKSLSVAAIFFVGAGATMAQTNKKSLTKDIQEVVVLGYGKTSTKSKSNASSTTISAEVLENRPSASFLSSIQGTAPGVSISTLSGSPGSGKIDVRVRGISSLSASTDPLYVIDGLMSSSTEFRNLNQNDIATLSVLRDAQATAIYGNHGANGVVVITTKSATNNSGLRLTYDVSTNIASAPEHKYSLANAKQLLTIHKLRGSGIGALMHTDSIANYKGPDTNWRDKFLRVSFGQQHNLGVRYGAQNFSSYTSLGYMDNEGIVPGTDFKRFTVRSNINGSTLDKRFSYSANISAGYSVRNQLAIELDSDISANIIQNPLLGSIFGTPLLPNMPELRGEDLWNWSQNYTLANEKFSIGQMSPIILGDILRGGIRNQYAQKSFTANLSGTYKLTEALSVTNKTGVTYKNDQGIISRTPYGYLSILNRVYTKGADYGGNETLTNSYDTTLNSVTSLNYEKNIGQHSISVGAYLDYLRGFFNRTVQRQNGLDPLSWSLGAGTGYVPFNPTTPTLYLPSISASKLKGGTLAYLGTFDYDYGSRYGLSGTVRRDGSYRFAPGNKWETFWSVAGRWNIDREAFMDGTAFNMLKLRASYGTNGNQSLVSSTANTNPLILGSNLVRDTYKQETGYDNLPAYVTSLTNPEISWEKISQANIGLDMALWRNKLQLNIDLYNKETKDMYLSVPISGVNGQFTIRGNNGSMINRGIELNLRYTPIRTSNFKLVFTANGAYNSNKIKSLPDEDLTDDLVNKVGDVAYQWQLYRFVGVNSSKTQQDYNKKHGEFIAQGDYIFLNKDGQYTAAPTAKDRVLTGKPLYAPYTGGFGLEMDYKNFYLTSLFSFQHGGWARDVAGRWLLLPSYSQTLNVSSELLDAWTEKNQNTKIASLKATNPDLLSSSDRFLTRTDFVRLKNVSIGYNFRKDVIGNMPIRSMKVYLMGENLLTWTKWKGYDPETATYSGLSTYPNNITYSIGFNIEL